MRVPSAGFIFNFIVHGKADIHEFLNGVGQDILKMLIELNIQQRIAPFVQSLLTGMGGATGGFIGALLLESPDISDAMTRHLHCVLTGRRIPRGGPNVAQR